MSRGLPFRLLIITDRGACGDLVATLERALRGVPEGAVALMLREKDLPGGELLALARRLRALTRERGSLLLVNERLDVALACEADGLHLPAAGLPIAKARAAAPSLLLGRSTHAPEEAAAAEAAGADYLTFGPVHPTPSKAAYGAPPGLAGLAAARRACALPLYGLGGIDLSRAPGVIAAGADGVAGIRVVLEAPDPAAAVAGLLAATASR
ncbi:MAG: thiamine phosphate synthase [Deltaproteobacteria bacterium]|nr:thiamine phosphate synthase [Deltaproteobacteria bacterium]